MTGFRKWLSWALSAALALVFAGAGGAKLAGRPEMLELFSAIGIGDWFRYFTGAVEVAGALALLAPATATAGSTLLAATMAAAVGIHLFLIGGSPIPAAVLFALCAVLAVLRLPTAFWRSGRT